MVASQPDAPPGAPARLRPDPVLRRLQRGTGVLATAALRRMDEQLPWYRAMDAKDRSWVGLVAQAGIGAFVSWYSDPQQSPTITADVFGTAPRELTRSVTLRQTLELVRTVVAVVEDHVDRLAPAGTEQMLRESVLRYSREVAFAAAEVYAQAAEARGAWDARLEALVVDSLMRGEPDDGLVSRAAALGWDPATPVCVVAGMTPANAGTGEQVVEELRRVVRRAGGDALVGVQGAQLVVVVGGPAPAEIATLIAHVFEPGPVVVGPVVAGLASSARSARAALAGQVAARAWPDAPRPVAADDLLPERVLAGDVTARRALVDRVYRPLAGSPGLLDTLTAYTEHGGSLEATARALFVHPNTVRYRLRRIAEVCGWAPTDARHRFVLQVALAAGRLSDAPSRAGRL